MVIGTRLRPVAFTAAMVLTPTVLVAVGMTAFSYYGVIFPWFFQSVGAMLSGALVFADRARLAEIRISHLKSVMHGKISEQRIANIVKHPEILRPEPTSKILSIMFIDIVGFSQLTEQQTPSEAFTCLQSVFSLLRNIVLKYNGVVDKTQGDAMLCYFGYGPDGLEVSREHADDALCCAIEIQEAMMARNIAAATAKTPICPLRIGINTAAVFIGNLGDENHFDYTIIGSGVNLAKRLESACQLYCVMIGSTSYDTLLRRDSLPVRLTKRFIPIKHSETPLESYECDPFFERKDLVNVADTAFRKFLAIERRDPRTAVPEHSRIFLRSPYGLGRVVDFSRSGFRVILDKYIGSGIQIDFSLDGEGSATTLQGSVNLVGEVRWGRPLDHGYLHGILIKNLSAKQKELLEQQFRRMVRSADVL